MAVEGKFIEKIALLVFVRVIFRCFSPSQKPQITHENKDLYILHTVWLVNSPFLQAEILVIAVSIDLIGLWQVIQSSSTREFLSDRGNWPPFLSSCLQPCKVQLSLEPVV